MSLIGLFGSLIGSLTLIDRVTLAFRLGTECRVIVVNNSSFNSTLVVYNELGRSLYS